MPKFERKIEIGASVDKVWEVMTNPQHWHEWFPGVDSISNVTSTGEGGTFEWTDEGKSGHGTVVKAEPMKLLEIMTQMDKDKDSHVFKLHAGGGFLGLNANECQVEYILDTLMGGGILGDFIAGGNPKDAMRVDRAMRALKKLAEGK